MVVSTYTSGSTDGSGYNITINFDGLNWTDAQQQAFIDSAEYLSTIIIGDVPDFFGVLGAGAPVSIDDIEISASLLAIDGVGGTLGQAGPEYFRTGSFLPITGVMEFDIADIDNYVANGQFDDIVLHEMLHALGFGTLWSEMGLLDDIGTTTSPNYRFTGSQAMYEYEALYGTQYATDSGALSGVAVESDQGGAATLGAHWDEATFGSELMTGFLNSGAFVSNMTIAALDDMGYVTNYTPTVIAAPCFTKNTFFETEFGRIRIDKLKAGDKIWTNDRGFQPILWMGRTEVEVDDGTVPIRIQKDALGVGCPEQHTLVSPLHRVVFDGQYVKAKHMVALPKIARAMGFFGRKLDYFHILLDGHETLCANGMLAESLYIGDGAIEALNGDQLMKISEAIADSQNWQMPNGEIAQTNLPEMGRGEFERVVKRDQPKSLYSRHSHKHQSHWDC